VNKIMAVWRGEVCALTCEALINWIILLYSYFSDNKKQKWYMLSNF